MGEVVTPGDDIFDPTCHLAKGDVRINDLQDPKFVVVRIKSSKTDSFRQGVSIYLVRARDNLCLVATVLGYMVQRGTEGGPLFTFEDGRLLTRGWFVSEVRKALTEMGHNGALNAGHSFRIGAVTTAAQKGVQDSLIKTLGQESGAYTGYIQTPPQVFCGVANTLAPRAQ